MVVRIRLARFGCKNRPFYRIHVADKKFARDKRYIENVGSYNPLCDGNGCKQIRLNVNRVKYWLSVGAQPSTPVARILYKFSLWARPPNSVPIMLQRQMDNMSAVDVHATYWNWMDNKKWYTQPIQAGDAQPVKISHMNTYSQTTLSTAPQYERIAPANYNAGDVAKAKAISESVSKMADKVFADSEKIEAPQKAFERILPWTKAEENRILPSKNRAYTVTGKRRKKPLKEVIFVESQY